MGFFGRTSKTCVAGCRFAASPVLSAGTSLARTTRQYNPTQFRGDAIAGLTVAMVAIPQSMAFATIAGVPPIYGVYTAIVGAIVGAFLTSSPHLSLGPTNTMSLLVSSGFVALAVTEGQVLQVAIMLTVFAGLIQILFALARMGELVRFVSHSVIVGFSAGAGVLIAVGQVPAFIGVSLQDTSSNFQGVGEKIDRLFQAIRLNAQHISWEPIAVGLFSLAIVLVCKRISKWLPSYLLATVAGGVVVYLMNWTEADLALVGDLDRGLPKLALPELDWHAYRPMFAPALAIALVGMLDAYGIGKKLAARSGDRIDANQEFLCVGTTNVVGGFFSCIPSTGSYSRSALNEAAGARTRFAGLMTGVFVAVIFIALAPAARYIPMTSIAAILFVIAYGLIDLDYVRRIAKSNPADHLVCIGTFVATLILSLEIAVFVGIFLTIALYLQRARQLYITEMVRTPGVASGFIERPLKGDKPQSICGEGDADHDADPDIVFLQVEGNLFFAAADDLQDRFNDLLASDARAVILRLKRTHMVDATIMHVIEQFNRQMKKADRHLILCGLRPRMYDRMREYGLVDDLGEENVIVSDNEPFSAAKAAVERARLLVGPKADETPEPAS
ncbi:SulP family inorganic anion transporter [Algisphaera agarilytica]|uniref:SulP family sulfate permease n=1 Tax=Algisphaera agarilytica TaxID=1385975 RepID=A0A7X0LML5_9BACT|nr:SulP family inorganic anion transporter [Algisphaera agarilytica]MBB6431148.1 SulP family sulfate permease [Algisphaera agarilytica]